MWAHRSYSATRTLQYFLAAFGASAAQGPIVWWVRGHRAHHCYTDTELDPYNARRGLLWSHIGWIIIKPRRTPGKVDVSDLKNDIVIWQLRYYPWLALVMTVVFPAFVAGLGWGDLAGGYVYAGFCRLAILHQVSVSLTFRFRLLTKGVSKTTMCVNSLAHYLCKAPFDDKHTPRDHVLTTLLTFGEGYHNFHHQFPIDHCNDIWWYQYDPIKWLIVVWEKLGLASHLEALFDT